MRKIVECYKCGKFGEEVKLLDAISGDEIIKMCEDCVKKENLPVIDRPTTSQLKESERPYSVGERLRRMSGVKEREKGEISKIAKRITDVTLDDLWRRKKRKELEERYEMEKKKNKSLKLVDNYHWHVFMARRKKKITRNELARLLGESETAIKMIENKEMPGDAYKLINKLEQFFGLKLKEEAEENLPLPKPPKEGINVMKEEVDIPEKIELEIEPEIEMEEIEEGVVEERGPARILKFDPNSVKNITISDLKEMKDRKEEKEGLKLQQGMEADRLMEEVEKEEKKRQEKKWKEETSSSFLGDDIELE